MTNLEEILKRMPWDLSTPVKLVIEDICREFERLIAERDAALKTWDRDSVQCENCGIRLIPSDSTKHVGLTRTEGEEESICGFCAGEDLRAAEQRAEAAEALNRQCICVYCGDLQTIEPQEDRREGLLRIMKAHLPTCKEHPLNLLAASEDSVKKLREALEKIRRTPAMPFPDRGAHSEAAFASAVWTAWSRIQQIANAALALNPPKDVTEATKV